MTYQVKAYQYIDLLDNTFQTSYYVEYENGYYLQPNRPNQLTSLFSNARLFDTRLEALKSA